MNARPDTGFFDAHSPIDLIVSREPVAYEQAIGQMDQRVSGILAGELPEAVWLLEHPPLYTLGTSAKDSDLLRVDTHAIYRSRRGGQVTYHGPGQRIAYVMLDLNRRQRDVRAYITALQNWLIASLGALDIAANGHPQHVGVWVRNSEGAEQKLAAIGVRLRRWVSAHGVAINISTDLGAYDNIVPCGLPQSSVTSLKALGYDLQREQIDAALIAQFERQFGPLIVQREL